MSNNELTQKVNSNTTMPVIFVGHGSPMNALADNGYTKALLASVKDLNPKAILVISAHWETHGTFITSTDAPKVIYDFYGFPQELYNLKYSVQGSASLAKNIINTLKGEYNVLPDNGQWGLDHGTWSPLLHMYPTPHDIPVLQLSLNTQLTPAEHFELAQKLKFLREQGVLIISSGNIVHNLRTISWNEKDQPYDWAIEFDQWIKENILKNNFDKIVNDFHSFSAGKMSVPTMEHYLPLIYTIGLKNDNDKIDWIFEELQNKSISMRSFKFQTT